MPFRIALIYDVKPAAPPPGAPEDAFSEFDSAQTVQAIATALQSRGHRVALVEATPDLLLWLRTHRVDLAFNIAEGAHGDARESRVPAILDFLGVPYTGSGVSSLALALDKAKAKQLFRAAGIPTPNFQRFSRPERSLDPHLRFPLMVKPNGEGSAKGVWRSSVATDLATTMAQVHRVFERYRQPVLVEEFIEGRELTVGVLGNPPRALPVMEIDFSPCVASGEQFYSWRMKEYQGDAAQHLAPTFWCPARLTESTARRVQELALAAHAILDCRDISRVDLRLGPDGLPYVLEVNPLPGLDPMESNLPRMARAAGLGYPELLDQMVEMVVARTGPASRETIEDDHHAQTMTMAGGAA